MSILDQFINYIKLDEEKRILVSIQKPLEPYLKDSKNKAMLKSSLETIVGSDFKQLEIGKNMARVTVKEGTEEENMKLIETELAKNIQMAMDFMSNMNDK